MQIRSNGQKNGLREYIVHPGNRDLKNANGSMCGEYIVRTDLPTNVSLDGDNRIDRGFEHFADLGHVGFVFHFRLETRTGSLFSHLIAEVIELRGTARQTIDLGEWTKLNPCYSLIPHLIRMCP